MSKSDGIECNVLYFGHLVKVCFVFFYKIWPLLTGYIIIEPQHEISNNVVCAQSDQTEPLLVA